MAVSPVCGSNSLRISASRLRVSLQRQTRVRRQNSAAQRVFRALSPVLIADSFLALRVGV